MSWPKWELGHGENCLLALAVASSVLQVKDERFVETLDVEGEGTISIVALD